MSPVAGSAPVASEWDRVVVTARWGALACSLLLAGNTWTSTNVVAGSAVLIAVTALGSSPSGQPRTTITSSVSRWTTAHLVITSTVPACVVGLTGGWDSPLLPCALPPILAIGLVRGIAPASMLCAFTVVVASGLQLTSQTIAWSAELFLLVIVAAHARRIELKSPQLTDLEMVNELLSELNGAALTVPLSTDPDGVVTATAERVRDLFRADAVRIELDTEPGPESIPLVARGEPVGRMTIERVVPLSAKERTTLQTVAAHAGLKIDNARRANRLRALAVEEERARIARELHDRLGQDLAGLGFMLDRISVTAAPDTAAEIMAVRETVRDLVVRLRDTLTDLRTEVDDEGLAPTLAALLARVRRRSGIETALEVPDRRFPSVMEREMLRIAQEAVVNAERHSNADRLIVRLTGDGRSARLTVIDNGNGLARPRAHHYGLRGMHERAAAIGGTLLVDSSPAAGTTVEFTVTP